MTLRRWLTRSLGTLAVFAVCAAPLAAAPAAVDPPFWTGSPTAAQFKKVNADRIAKAKAAIAKMIAAKGPRTLDNTLMPYDEASRWLDMAGAQSSLIENVHPDSVMRLTAEKVTQDVSSYATEISLNRKVYEALAAIDLKNADDETRFYVERELRDFRLAGVDKDDATRAKIRALRDTLVKIGQEFDRNIRENVRTIQVKPEELAGLPQDFIDGHKPDANGMVTLDINYPDYIPTMTYCQSEDVRKRLYMEFQNRAFPKNMDVLKRMLEGRNELAKLAGYPNWADYITANKMSGSAGTVRAFIDKVVAASKDAQERDYRTLLEQKQKAAAGASVVNFWEQMYYSEQVNKSQYDFDSQAMRPYLAYDRVKQGVLDISAKMFGVEFKRVPNAPVWHPSVECYELWDGGKLAGRFYLDMHPRPNKYNHAAQFDIRTGVDERQLPEAALVCNLPGGTPGDPGLCEMDDVNTFFHEFGHLLHSLFAGHRHWLGTSGIRTEHDFVEAPSQMLEEWMQNPKVLQTFALDDKNTPVPGDLVQKMIRASEFSKGLQVRRQMVYADLSLSIYDRDPAQVDINGMMKQLVAKYQPFPFVDDTHFACSFGHLDGYSAVYYTYMWSLVIAKDMFSAFDANDLLNPVVAKRYRDAVLAKGGSAPAAKLVESFLGRPFGFDAYQSWLNRVIP